MGVQRELPCQLFQQWGKKQNQIMEVKCAKQTCLQTLPSGGHHGRAVETNSRVGCFCGHRLCAVYMHQT